MKITNVRTKTHTLKDGRSFKVTYCEVDGETRELLKLNNGNYLLVTPREKNALYYNLLQKLKKGGHKRAIKGRVRSVNE